MRSREEEALIVVFLAASLVCAFLYFVASTSVLWLHQTYGQIAVSFAALVILSSFHARRCPKPKKSGRKFLLPRAIRDIVLLGFVASVITFGIFAYITATSRYVSASHAALVAIYSEFPADEGHYLFGVLGFTFFVSASLCLMAYFLDRGMLRAFRDVLRSFVFPTLMAYELWLLLADTKEMPIHVTFFVNGTPLGGILTNWFVLVVSSGLFTLGLVHRRLTLMTSGQSSDVQERSDASTLKRPVFSLSTSSSLLSPDNGKVTIYVREH